MTEKDFEERLERFDQAWQTNPPPVIDDFLPHINAPSSAGFGRRELLVELVMIDLECRWRRHPTSVGPAIDVPATGDEPIRAGFPEKPLLEDYVNQHLDLLSVSDLTVELVVQEYRVRNRWGDRPDHETYINRFPQLADSLPLALVETDRQFGNTPRGSASRIDTDDLSTGNQRNAPASLDARLPDSIGRYRVVRLLGKGGFGLVYLARDDELQRRVAIKVPHAALLSSVEVAKMNIAEARAAAKLDHQNIVPVYDVGATDAMPCYIVSRFIDGTDLATTIKQHQFSHSEAASIAVTIAEALHYAHTHGVVHRDIKPANILIDPRREPFIVDFGLALRDQDLGHGPHYAGTPAYMSPEQARGEGHRVDGRSDIFSLGVVLYEMLVGRPPFAGDTSAKVIKQVICHEPKPLRQLSESVPRELERICFRALSKPASQRYLTAGDMADDLRHFLESQSADTSSASGQTRAREDTPITPTTSDSRPINVIPKGLRSFDRHDADFFLELLPGPRDREGLPDSLRFWKARIEETDPDNTFPVGLIYGPSGCGKSSLVRAGLLPRLSEDVLSIYIEATAKETETRLLHGLRKCCPALVDNLSLKDTLAQLRRGQGVPIGRKVLIVLDQFEQWLHAKKEEEHTDLVQALRQCDGGRVQCMVMVRDDFWMAASRFMRELEVRLVEAENSAAVDLFPIRHAEKVLAAFGRALGALPDNTEQTSQEQKDFLKQSVTGLSEEGKVICVRLALFAEMLKGKSWTPATLKEVGGATGVSVTFLEETFSASTAPPEHRYHQKAARAILNALLPESGIDIKGEMKSYAELLQVSSYAGRLQDFDDLIRILDSEIRLITPIDPNGVETDDDSITQADLGQKCFQLTHDYLVPSLRDWLTRKQKETRKGRAELRLAERSALWNAKPENRHLPAWWEFANIRLLTIKKNWTQPQRKLMVRAGRIHAVRCGIGLLLALAIAITIRQIFSATRHRLQAAIAASEAESERNEIQTAVAAMSTAREILVPHTIKDLDDFSRESVLPELRRQFENAEAARKLPLAYALAHFDDVRADVLVSQVEGASPNEFPNFVAALERSSTAAVVALENAAGTADREKNWRYKARLAMLALELTAPSLVQETCRLRSNPIQRTLFIEECSKWHGDLSKLAQLVAESDDGPVRSGIILVAGSVPVADVLPPEKKAWGSLLSNWYTIESDSLTHSAAVWALRQWNLGVPEIATQTAPADGMNWFVNGLGMTMLKIPAGSFLRKDGRFGGDDPIEQTVNLTRSFLLADGEVTRAQFQQFIDDPQCPQSEKPQKWLGALTPYSPTGQHPVQGVNWYDAVLFCNWLSRRDGLAPCYMRTGEKEKDSRGVPTKHDAWRLIPDTDGYRLPTEAEWEYACRAGTVTAFSYGDDESLLDRYAVYGRSNRTELRGSKLPNDWGLFNLHGNVIEWCHDSYGAYGSEATVSDPMGPAQGPNRVLRGGSFLQVAGFAQSANRSVNISPDVRFSAYGFRVARNYAVTSGRPRGHSSSGVGRERIPQAGGARRDPRHYGPGRD